MLFEYVCVCVCLCSIKNQFSGTFFYSINRLETNDKIYIRDEREREKNAHTQFFLIQSDSLMKYTYFSNHQIRVFIFGLTHKQTHTNTFIMSIESQERKRARASA